MTNSQREMEFTTSRWHFMTNGKQPIYAPWSKIHQYLFGNLVVANWLHLVKLNYTAKPASHMNTQLWSCLLNNKIYVQWSFNNWYSILTNYRLFRTVFADGTHWLTSVFSARTVFKEFTWGSRLAKSVHLSYRWRTVTYSCKLDLSMRGLAALSSTNNIANTVSDVRLTSNANVQKKHRPIYIKILLK